MKKNLLSIIFIISFVSVVAGKTTRGNNIGINTTYTIDQNDSVVFDVDQAIFTSTSVEIPVLIFSDDSINALDFWFPYNHNDLLFDTIIDLTVYMTSSYYYNTVDSTLRFSSYSLQNFGIGVPLVRVKFTLLNGLLNINDIYNMSALLNGDPCTIRLKGMLPMDIQLPKKLNLECKTFPNPAKEFITFEFNDKAFFNTELIFINGIGETVKRIIVNSEKIILPVQDLPKGVYYYQVNSKEKVYSTGKVIVSEP